jgi:hypothetical protein
VPNSIEYVDGLELWVWDSGELEGFAVFLNGTKVDEQLIPKIKFPIAQPQPKVDIVVEFGGVDGGATKVVDVASGNKVLGFLDSGNTHSYTVVK